MFAALAMALVVTYRSSGVVNFATGAIGLYVAETYALLRTGKLFVPIPGLPTTINLHRELGFAAATAIALAVAALLGLLLHYLVFRPLRSAPAVAKAVASVGVMIILQAVIGIRLGTKPIVTKAILPTGNITILGQGVRSDRLWFALAVIGVTLVLGALFKFTRFGLATRAVAETERGAYVTGLSPARVSRANWILSAVVSGIAGILISPIVPIVPISYTLFIVPALAAALVGGFTSVGVAVAAGLVIGMVQSEFVFLQVKVKWLPGAGMPELVSLVVILGVLLFRGRPLPDRGAVVTQTLGRAPRPERILLSTVVGVGLGLVGIFATSGVYRYTLIETFLFALLGLSWIVVTGYAGQISFAQLSFAGVGAFALFRFAENWGVPFPIAPLLAGIAAAVIGVVFGLPALRIRGLPVAVVTLALSIALEAFWFTNSKLNGGLQGARIKPPSIFGYTFRLDALSSRIPFAIMSLGLLAATAVGVAILRRHRLGAAMLAVKANERSAAAAGIDVARTKLIAFGLGAFIAGVAGTMLGYFQGAAVPQSYNAVLGIGLFATAYLAGITSIAGGITSGVLAAGGIFYTVVDRNLDLGSWYPAISGALVILTVIKNPEGVVGTVKQRHLVREGRRARTVPDVLDVDPVPTTSQPVARPAAGPPLLSVRDLSVRYGSISAVTGVSFDVEQGSIVGLIGPNGAGKTTLIDAVSGFTDSRGMVEFDGSSMTGLAPHQRARRGLARTFQSVELYDDLTVEENIEVGQAAVGDRWDRSSGRAESDLDRLCALLKLEDVRARPVKELSAGYRQLVSVARALAGSPKVLLLDEPAGGLDTEESRWLGDRLRDVRDAGVTVLMVDHDMSLVLGVCDRIHVLDLGQLIASGCPTEIQSDPRVAAAYLGSTGASLAGDS
ncbi:MAG: branched-chain amino acid transporter ATPase/permease [Acidimicrobiales bacterium]|nr:branched-chain amino acid transporter ATPase/permease [Acidimicrobiales bacterium]